MPRLLIPLMLALPGVVIALAAKPFILGEGMLLLGVLLALGLPAIWMLSRKE